jgi:hypothetical protein
MGRAQMDRFFVRVYASDRRGLVDLQGFGLDLFSSTAGTDRDDRLGIDGLLSMAEVERLVRAGYQVLVEEHESARSRAHLEVRNFENWVAEDV